MKPIEIIVIIACVLIVAGVIVGNIIKKRKDKKAGRVGCSGCCATCSHCSHSTPQKQK